MQLKQRRSYFGRLPAEKNARYNPLWGKIEGAKQYVRALFHGQIKPSVKGKANHLYFCQLPWFIVCKSFWKSTERSTIRVEILLKYLDWLLLPNVNGNQLDNQTKSRQRKALTLPECNDHC